MPSVTPIIEYLQTKLREAGPKRFRAIAAETGLSESILPKLAYGMRDNPRVQTIQPLLDYFDAIERGERELPSPGPERQAA
jgi:hypothetical protein